jgi:penicillin-binding protein 1A
MKPYVHYQITSMLQDVTRIGTAARAGRILQRSDIAGKTGTTNDQKDAWFCGFTPNKVTTVWIGFDQLKPLGKRETATQAALPLWIDFMKSALKDSEVYPYPRPKGLIDVTLDAASGLQPTPFTLKTIKESLISEQIPTDKDHLEYMRALNSPQFAKQDLALEIALKNAKSPRHRQRLIREAQQRHANALRRYHAKNEALKRLGKQPLEPFNKQPATPRQQFLANELGIDAATLQALQKQFKKEAIEIPEQLF